MASVPLFGSEMLRPKYSYLLKWGSSERRMFRWNPGFRPLNVFGVAEDLHRLSGKKVDVFELSELDAGPFRDAVLRDAVLL